LEGAFQALDSAVCPDCEIDLTRAACQRCLADATGLSIGCSGCVASWLSCTFDNCLLSCEGEANAGGCKRCITNAGCTRQLVGCGFAG
jgi:hypothetical protein